MIPLGDTDLLQVSDNQRMVFTTVNLFTPLNLMKSLINEETFF